jgi:hypothetical protein
MFDSNTRANLQWKGNAASGSCKLLTMDPAIKIYGISPNLAVTGLAPLTGRAVLAGAQPRLELGTFSRALADYAARRQK